MRRIVLTLALLSLAFAPAPFPKTPRKRNASHLEGLWQEGETRFRLTPTTMEFLTGIRSVYELRVDRSVAPTAFELTGMKGNLAEGARFSGIIKVEGDTLTMCYRPGGDRPAAFDPRAGTVSVYRRVR